MGIFSGLCCYLLPFSKFTFSKKSFKENYPLSNSLDSDQDRHSVGHGPGPNCLQRLSADKLPAKVISRRQVTGSMESLAIYGIAEADPGFLERGFICIKVWGVPLLILSHFLKYPMKMK